MPYLSALEVMFHEEALYQVYVPLTLPLVIVVVTVPVCKRKGPKGATPLRQA